MSQNSDPVLPPLDGSLTISEAVDFNFEHNSAQPFYVFSAENDSNDIVQISHLEFGRACHRAAHILRPKRHGDDGAVIAVIGLVDALVYQPVVLGLIRAGYVPFPISPRNSPAAIVHLLRNSSCHAILGTQTTLQSLFDGVKEELSNNLTDWPLEIREIPNIVDLFPRLGKEKAEDPFEHYPPPETRPRLDALALYIHSSGSTGFPKCIPQTFQIMIEWSNHGPKQLREFKPRIRMGGMALPSFHTMGFYSQVLQPLYGIICVALYPPTVYTPDTVPIIPSAENIMEHLKKTKCDAVITIPALLHIWAQSQAEVEFLKSCHFVGYGGGPLSEKTGDNLAAAGVNIKCAFGATEFGAPTVLQLERGQEGDWEWMKFSDRVHVNWVDQGDGTYECQFLTTDTHHPAVENIDNPRGYATSDVFVKHPTKPDLWKIVGRVDDVIIHSSGEKTVPGPMEEVITSNPAIRGAIMFGRNHDQAGILVEPAKGHEIDPSDHEALATFRNHIWPSIEEANVNAPAFSRIYKEMVLIVAKDKALPRSPKHTVMRKAALKLYEPEIEDLYNTVETSAGGGNVIPPSAWETDAVIQWLLDQANDIQSRQDISSAKDLFEQGFDSLSATFLRLRIVSALRASEDLVKSAQAIGQNTVYTYPVVKNLARFIVSVVQDPKGATNVLGGKDAIENMIEKYSAGLDGKLPTNQPPRGDGRRDGRAVVLLTGSTGNLGAQLLPILLQESSISKVYALNRPSHGSQTILQRHEDRFKDKALELSVLKSEKLRFIEGEASEDHLGLSVDMYHELQHSVTIIIHNAWRLDFNLTLASFEGNIRGTRNLLDFARNGPSASFLRFIFTSSVTSAQSWDQSKGPYPEEVVEDASYAVGGGYGESKYTSERILARSGLKVSSLRIGQVSGGLPNGAWATTDWVPILVKSSLALGALPDASGVVSWTPMDAVAQAVLDIAFAKEPPSLALNIVHPRPVPWKDIMQAISLAISEQVKSAKGRPPVVPFKDWLERLEASAKNAKEEDFKRIPAIKLLNFFRVMGQANQMLLQGNPNQTESGGLSRFDTTKAQDISATLKTLQSIGAEDTQRWVEYWNNSGFFD